MANVLIINNEKDRRNLGFAPRIQTALPHEDEASFEILHYTDISKERMLGINPDMIFLTGRLTYGGDVKKDEYAAELALIRETDVPLFGICLGHQLISLAYGAKLGRIFGSADDEEDVREHGFVKIHMHLQDPLFNGMDDSFIAYEYHLEEVKDMPRNFELLASSQMCEIQAIRHQEKPIYGVQFHPEAYDSVFPDGKIILQNFYEFANPRKFDPIPAISPLTPA